MQPSKRLVHQGLALPELRALLVIEGFDMDFNVVLILAVAVVGFIIERWSQRSEIESLHASVGDLENQNADIPLDYVHPRIDPSLRSWQMFGKKEK